MKKLISLLMMALIVSSCSVLRPHKQTVEQGNIINHQQVERLHTGMTTAQVKEIMGDPIASNIFDDNRMSYIYTMERGYSTMTIKRVICTFKKGRLANIQRG